MAREMVVIGCKLPHGLILRHPEFKNKEIRIAGLRDSKIIGSTHMTTEIDAEFWALWKLAYSDYAPLKNGSIFEARDEAHATAKAKDLRKEKTGFEPLDPKSMGVEPEDKKK